MGIEAKVPEAAAFVGQNGIHGRVIEKQHAARGIALVVFLNGLDQCGRRGGTVALKDDACAIVNGHAQSQQGLFVLAFAVVALQNQATRPIGELDATAVVHPLQRPHQVAVHRLAGVGKGAAQAFDQGQLDGRLRSPCAPRKSHKR